MRNRVRELREAAGLTQEDLRLKLRVSRQTVISIERGTNGYSPSLELAFQIAELFETTVEEVFVRDHKKSVDAAAQ